MNDEKKNSYWQRTAEASDLRVRLDKFWGRELADEGVSRGRVKAWIESGMALVDGKPVTKGKYRLLGSETLSIGATKSEAGPDAPQAMPGDLNALFEDEHILVVDKPAGLTTHPAPSESGPTLVNHLLHQWPDIAGDASGMDEQRPGIVHRLDKDTSGLIAVARTEGDRLKLASDFAERRVKKVYLAIVHGCPVSKTGKIGKIDAPIGRHPTMKTKMAVVEKGGREARSEFQVLWTGPRGLASLVAVRIFTGRTHQIRVHMAHIGHPLLGDAAYGPRENAEWSRRTDRLGKLAQRQMLHAFYLSFTHPASGEQITKWRKPPEDFLTLLAGLTPKCLRVGIVGMPGCGKSSLLGFLQEMGLPTFSADDSVARLYGPGGDGAAMIRQRFGGQYSLDDGGVDKPAMFEAMKQSENLRREIMDMIHPMVRHECEEFYKTNRDEPVAFAEIPLLLEGGWHKDGHVDYVVGVTCPEGKRTGELREARGLDADILAVFDSWQWPEEEKLKQCDIVLNNAKDLDTFRSEAETLQKEALDNSQKRYGDFASWVDGLWPGLAEEFGNQGDGD